MKTPFTREQIHAGVREDIATCLGIEPEDVNLDTNFFRDLDGESIDMLDFSFRSERRYSIRSPFSRLHATEAWQFDESGKLTEHSYCWLQTEFPNIDWRARLAGASLASFRDALTIELIVELLYFAQFDDTPHQATVSK